MKNTNIIWTIISIRSKKIYDSYKGYTTFYFPTFKFTVDGKEYIKESFSAVTENIYEEGQKIKIAYYKENPMDAIILADKKGNIAVGIGTSIYAILVGLAVLIGSTKESYTLCYLLAILGFIVVIICCFISTSDNKK